MADSAGDLWRLPKTASELRDLTDDQVIEYFNHWLKVRNDPSWPDAVPFWRSEWEYRRQLSVAERAERIANRVLLLTVAIFALTAAQVLIAIFL